MANILKSLVQGLISLLTASVTISLPDFDAGGRLR